MDEELRLLERRALAGDMSDKAALDAARRRAGVSCELYDLVSKNLLELAWRANYALSPAIGLSAFIGAFKERGVRVDRNGDDVFLEWRKKIGGVGFEFSASLNIGEIAQGWRNHPAGSPRSLYDSLCEIYDRMGGVFSGRAERSVWSEIRKAESLMVCRLMDDVLEESISNLHEHAFLSALGEVPAEGAPRLFYEVKESFPMDLYERAKKIKAICGPDAPYILETDASEFNELYHPSVSAMEELFWGMYLDALAKEKGYPVLDEDSRLRTLVARGIYGLAPGRDIWPPKR